MNICGRLLQTGWLGVVVLCLCGCLGGFDYQNNPSFPLSVDDAKRELDGMKQAKRELRRPVVVIGGWQDTDVAATSIANRLREMVSNPGYVLVVDYSKAKSFVSARQRLVQSVQEAFPSENPKRTAEVDVVAYSMGGLLARYATREDEQLPNARCLDVIRLFTISTPHRGADAAQLPAIDDFMRSMRHDSPFLVELTNPNGQNGYYRIYPYVRLGDIMIGEENAAPQNFNPWWVPNRPMEDAHWQAYEDPRLLADIARRLRYETPYTRTPPRPIPHDDAMQSQDKI